MTDLKYPVIGQLEAPNGEKHSDLYVEALLADD